MECADGSIPYADSAEAQGVRCTALRTALYPPYSTPVRNNHEQVGDIDLAVAVEVRCTRRRRGCARPPLRNDRQQVILIDNSRAIDIGEIVRPTISKIDVREAERR